jgi:pyruvate/2-oxoglutarate dehydrogenase complex dihydrolipoamide dehydrogenase (E3) component
MSREDPDVADEIQRILGGEGIEFLAAAETLAVYGRSGEDVSLTVRTSAREQAIEGSEILVAAGRVPNTAGIGLETSSVELDARGYICVNERLETTAPNVWAIGECASSPQFLRTRRSTTSGSLGTILPAEISAHAISWCPTACSPIPCSRMCD